MVQAVHDPVGIALAEDIGSGDLTARYFLSPQAQGAAQVVCRTSAVISGLETAREVFLRVDPGLEVNLLCQEGDRRSAGAGVMRIEGGLASILSAERTALNFLQRLSGIATLTRAYVDAVEGTAAVILDTRKTTPGLRVLEKAAVRAGGGQNHRFGLFDRVMVKDNHLAGDDSDGWQEKIDQFKDQHPGISIEFEADRLDQVEAFLELNGVDVILLDNMTPKEIRQALQLGQGRVRFEASGGVNLQTVRSLAETGVDYISVGALTHSAPAADLALDLDS